MRVLLVHNRYQHVGGEDTVARDETALLATHGVTVEVYERLNHEVSEIGKLRLAAGTVWSQRTIHDIASVVARFKPDVIHTHNTFPLVSPSVYHAASRMGVPVVQTLHNFRLACLQAMFLREGKVCEDCLGRLPWRGVARACYRDSVAQSAVAAAALTVHRAIGTFQRKVSQYIALNEFCRRKFIEAGLPAERIAVKPNFVDRPAPVPCVRAGFLFVGRLSPEKGIATLAAAARLLPESVVRVAGSGPEEHLLEGVPAVKRLAFLGADEVGREMSAALALLLPSIWYENFPRTVVEAFACGLPVIASRIGALAELVEDGVTGLLFTPGSAEDLARKMAWAQAHPQQMSEMGHAARSRYEREFTPEVNFTQLMGIYRTAMERR